MLLTRERERVLAPSRKSRNYSKVFLGLFFVACIFSFANVARADITTGLVGHWTFDSADTNWTASTTADGSGNSNTGTLTNFYSATSTVTGQINQGLNFDGVDDWVRAADTDSLSISTMSALTMSAWVKVPSLTPFATVYPVIFEKTGSFTLFITGDPNKEGSIVSQVNFSDGTRNQGYTTAKIITTTGEWYHVVAVATSTSVSVKSYPEIYINGVLQSATNSTVSTAFQDTNALGIGRRPNAASQLFKGDMDDARIYNRALTAQDIADLYTQGRSYDTNEVPVVSAGIDQTIQASTTLTTTLAGIATDDGLPTFSTMTVTWSKVSGPGTVTFANANSTSTTASFSDSGTYVLQLSASDTALSDTDTVTIYVNAGESPVITAGSPSWAVASGTTQVSLSVTTNEIATCKYDTASSTVYANMPNTFTATNSTTHSSALAGLSNGTAYTYYVRCQDSDSNQSFFDYTIYFYILADNANPSDFYASPTGTSGGDGSIDDPWDIETALADNTNIANANYVVKPGDTIWLRGGTYTVDDNIIQSYIQGSIGKFVTVRQYSGERAILQDIALFANAPWADYRDFEMAGTDTNRISAQMVSVPTDITIRYPFTFSTSNIRAVNLILHDFIGLGISNFSASSNSEMYGNIVYYNGYLSNTRHGPGIYSQNTTGLKDITDNIVFSNFTVGLEIQGTTAAYINNYNMAGNTLFNNGQIPGYTTFHNFYLAAGGGSHNVNFTDNYVYSALSTTTGANTIGDNAESPYDAYDLRFTNNYIADFPLLYNWQNLTFTGNTVAKAATNNVFKLSTPSTVPSYAWNNNTYYTTTGDGFQFADQGQVNGTSLAFSAWQSATGFDANSIMTSANPTQNSIFVRANKFEQGRANITVYNWVLDDSVNADISNVDIFDVNGNVMGQGSLLNPGDSYELHNVQDYFDDVVTGVYSGTGSITIPMTGHTVADLVGFSDPGSTFPEFGTFVLIKTADGVTPTLTTSTVSSINTISATLNGTINTNNESSATQHGFAWGTSATLSGNDTATTSLGTKSGTGAFTSSLASLTCGTTYYSRAYATNSAGTGLGDIVSFTTSTCPAEPIPSSSSSSGGSSVQSRYNNLIAMGNITAANALAQQYPGLVGTQQPVTVLPTTQPSTTPPTSLISRTLDIITSPFVDEESTDEPLVTPQSVISPLTRLFRNFTLALFSTEDKESLPSEVVFAKPANLPSYDVSKQVSLQTAPESSIQQATIHVPQGKPIDLAVKADKPVKEVTGYLTIKKIDRKTALLDLEKQKKSGVNTANLASALSALETIPEDKFVLLAFKYTDPDSDGIYTATITAPKVHGEYDIMTILEYKDVKLGYRELHLTAVIDPEGYVYHMTGKEQTRITNAKLTLYVKDSKTEQFIIWPADQFKQVNPQTTDITGNYSFLVPEGIYQLSVTAPGYYDYTGSEFTVTQGAGVHENIELTKRNWLKTIWRWVMGMF